MSELISGKEALIALANGEKVQYSHEDIIGEPWTEICTYQDYKLDSFFNKKWRFRLKPRTITLNNIEVPAPFEPKEGERFYYFSDEYTEGWASAERTRFYGDVKLGCWRTEAEIKQVTEALRSVFKHQ